MAWNAELVTPNPPGFAMSEHTKIVDILEALHAEYPAGFAAALHIRMATPRYMFQAYARDWTETYSREGMVVNDPTALWGFRNTGAIRWSELDVPDPHRIMERAATEAGLRYGFTVAMVREGTRSIASFARTDREATDADLVRETERLRQLHCATRALEALSPDDHARLRAIAVRLTHG